jgi:hypothetical protein
VTGIRFHVDPGDVPPVVAARRMGMTLEAFNEKLEELRGRGFPAPDPTTGNYDLHAIDAWRKARYPHLFPTQLTPAPTAHDAKAVVRARLREVSGG